MSRSGMGSQKSRGCIVAKKPGNAGGAKASQGRWMSSVNGEARNTAVSGRDS